MRVAVVVPFRDQAEQGRAAHLRTFIKEAIPRIRTVLQSPTTSVHVFIVEQEEDGRKFNRGALLNVGIAGARSAGADIIITHDVDLIPSRPFIETAYRRAVRQLGLRMTDFVHLASAWPRYVDVMGPLYFGGVVAGTVDAWERSDGYPNTFWGWGGEDNALRMRASACTRISRVPRDPDAYTDLEEGAPVRAATKLCDGGRPDWRNMRRREDVRRDVRRRRGTGGLSDATRLGMAAVKSSSYEPGLTHTRVSLDWAATEYHF